MSHVLITGAAGFVGHALTQRLLADVTSLPQPLRRLTVIDQRIAPDTSWLADTRVRALEGSFGDAAVLQSALDEPVDVVFHLASVPGSLAEREQELGREVNLQATLDLLYCLADQSGRSQCQPRVVFASSVAVYGPLDPQVTVTEATPVRPTLSYGAHKLMTEILLADMSRRGVLDGVSVRLPGIVARPLSPTGHGSAFMSDLIRRLSVGEPYVCPVSAQARAWWMSLPCCINNLLHAARLPLEHLPSERVVQLPVLTATIAEVVQVIEFAMHQQASIRFIADERIEALFGRYPPIDVPTARALSFVDDGDLQQLFGRALSKV